MKLYIAEKPSLGRAIAEVLGISEKNANYITCKNDQIVTWCFGHLLELYMPEDYDEKYKQWKKETLPIIPKPFRLKVADKARQQITQIGKLLNKASCAVNAGDPDREGQLLVDEVLEYCGWTGPTQRVWLAALDEQSVKKALAAITDNAAFAPLRDAARARSQADWLIGLNATRAMTIAAREAGIAQVQTLGRVQTPTLGLVVRRDREIKAFKPVNYFRLRADFQHDNGAFFALFKPADSQTGLDSEGRLVDGKVADSLVASVTNQRGKIEDVRRETKKQAPPLPHCLSSLQKAASAKLGMTAMEVLDAAQALYEARLTTYPRTDCRYLPAEQFGDAARILKALASVDGLQEIATGADSKRKGAVWDTAKVTAHHAIVPTGEAPPPGLPAKETALYLMIGRAFCLQFYAPCEYEAQTIRVQVAGTEWEAKGRRIIAPGWAGALVGDEADSGDRDSSGGEGTAAEMNGNLPSVNKSDTVHCVAAEKQAKQTTPPPRFTEGTLVEAMTNVHRFVEDSEAKKTLKDNEGIGTEATRAKIIENLKKSRYLTLKGKTIVSTSAGQQLIDLCPPVISDPITTAKWETRLTGIVNGKETLSKFINEQIELLGNIVNAILNVKMETTDDIHTCPKCGKALVYHAKGKYGPWWGCSGYPDCTEIFSDEKGKPKLTPKVKMEETDVVCPECGKPLQHNSAGKYGPYFACFNKEAHDGKVKYWPDVEGVPTEKKKTKTEVTGFTCPKCKKPIERREKNGGFYFACFNREAHGGAPQFWPDNNGRPDFEKKKPVKKK